MAQPLISCPACGGFSPVALAECLHCAAPLVRRSRWARLVQFVAGGGFMMTLAACYGMVYRPQQPGVTDNDYDGSPVPTDCDDTNAARYPGAQDPDGDGIDQNCDGVDGWRDPAVIAAPAPAGTAPAPAPEPAHVAVPP